MPKPRSKPIPKPKSAIPASFIAHKKHILAQLSQPDDQYKDLSPKGSVDVRIRDLIDAINQLDGAVTTSSCSGRIAVFIEGKKQRQRRPQKDGESPTSPVATTTTTTTAAGQDPPAQASNGVKKAKGKGKGLSGRWLFVSHDPLPQDPDAKLQPAGICIPDSLHPLLLTSSHPQPPPHVHLSSNPSSPSPPRLITLSFSPLILHISCASLSHAKPLLRLAADAGFRESGLQSLSCLDQDPDLGLELEHASATNATGHGAGGAGTWPVVAIRSVGLGFASVVGFVDDQHAQNGCRDGEDDDGGEVKGLVTEDVMGMLLSVANARFAENEQRADRLRSGVKELLRAQDQMQNDGGIGWEDKYVRAARMRAEGLARRDVVNANGEEGPGRRALGRDLRQDLNPDQGEDDEVPLGFDDMLEAR